MLAFRQATRREIAVVLALVLITALVFGLVVSAMIYSIPVSDYAQHILFARDILTLHQFTTAHVLFEALVIGFSSVLPISMESAAWLVAVAFYAATAVILYVLVRRALDAADLRRWSLAALVAVVLLLVTPISLITLPAHHLYYGYVGINVLHNPTMVLLKPFALLLFCFTIALLEGRARLSAKTLAAAALLVFLSVFAKPNFALVLLSALLIVIAYRLVRRRSVDLSAQVVLLIVPLVFFLALDYVGQYVLADSDGGGIFAAPLLSIYYYDRDLALLPIQLLASILFPLVVYWLYRPRDLAVRFAWLLFFVGAAQMYLLAESGQRLADGNFWWSAQIALFILFVVSTLAWLRRFGDPPRWRAWLCLAVLALHVISGVVFYVVQLQSPVMKAWW